MYNLFILIDNITNGFLVYVINFLYLISILCAIFVIINKNPIISVLFLIGLFITISIYLILLGLNFLGLSYLLVYVGAISILFLFILMLINIRISELSSDTRNSIPLGIIVFVLFYTFMSIIIPFNVQQINIKDFFREFFGLLNENNKIIHAVSSIWEGNIIENFHINTLGNIIYTNYFIWLIIASIILLLAMIGSIVITIKETN